MKEHPILFSADMVKAILRGDKSQTRRVIKPQPISISAHTEKMTNDSVIEIYDQGTARFIKCPYGQPGDRLWVRETWAIVSIPDGTTARKLLTVFRADNPRGLEQPEKWKPSIHMPRRASRIMLEVVNVRVERVQDMSLDNIYAEGIHGPGVVPANTFMMVMGESTLEGAEAKYMINEFSSLWDTINAKRGYGWESNPYVWAIEFKALET